MLGSEQANIFSRTTEHHAQSLELLVTIKQMYNVGPVDTGLNFKEGANEEAKQ